MSCLFLLTNLDRKPTNLTWPNLGCSLFFRTLNFSPHLSTGTLENPLLNGPARELADLQKRHSAISYLGSSPSLTPGPFLALFTPPYKSKAICCLTFETLTDVIMGTFSLLQFIVPLPLSQSFLSLTVIVLLNNFFSYLLLGFFNLTLQLLKST